MAKLNISPSPHVRSYTTTGFIMYDVLIAMLPAAVFGVYNCYRMGGQTGGIIAVLVILICCASAVLAEYLYERGMKKPVTVPDGSAMVTGLILALNMPTAMEYKDLWICVLGSFFAIIVVKQLFGGLGQNFMNPALAARCFLLISFAGPMTKFIPAGSRIDAVTSATPLADLKMHGLYGTAEAGGILTHYSISDLLVGTIPGTIGETSVIALLLGAAYLLFKRVINWKIPVLYIGVEALFALIYGTATLGAGDGLTYMLIHVLSGGLIFGAFFMATDYVTSPITPKGQVIYAVCLGLLTAVFRIWGGMAEGVSYTIIFCNLLVPLIEKYTIPKPFGKEARS